MQKLKLFCASKYMYIIVTLFAYACFLFEYNKVSNIWFKNTSFDTISLVFSILYSLLVFFLLLINKNTLCATYSIMLFPFIIANNLADFSFLAPLLIPFGVATLGIIIHCIIYKTKFKINKFTPCLLLYVIALSIGGIGAKGTSDITINFKWWYILVMLGAGMLVLIILNYLNSDCEPDFNTFSYAMVLFGLLIVYEMLTYMLHSSAILHESYFISRSLYLGWGNCNTVAIVLLPIIPFAFYKASRVDKHFYIYLGLGYLFILAILITMSRGGIFACILGYIITILVIRSNNYKKYILANLIIILLFVSSITLALLIKPEIGEMYITNVQRVNFDTYNGRKQIYESGLEIYKANPVLGVGIVSTSNWVIGSYKFVRAHQTILQMMVVSGTFGLLLMIIHLGSKYYYCLRHPSIEGIVLALSFLFPGIYGMFDVTYLSCYTMVLVFSMFMTSDYMNIKYKWFNRG